MSNWFDQNGMPEDENQNAEPTSNPEQKDNQTADSLQPPNDQNTEAELKDNEQQENTGFTPPSSDYDNRPSAYPQNPAPYNNQYPRQPYGNPQGGFYSHNGYNYNPYNGQRSTQQPGIQPEMQPMGKPPKKKKSGATIAIATLSVVCAAAIITLAVLLALALSQNRVPVNSSDSSKISGENTSAPILEIAEEDEDAKGLSTPSIVQMNLDSTVVITMFAQQSSFGFGGGNYLAEVGGASGIIMSANGYIITNAHVVINDKTGKPYDRIDVKTYDGTVYEGAEVIGSDMDTDLAVIKVGAVNLKPSEFGDSASLRLGDKVVAIGNSGGLTWSTTEGIVSGLARDVYRDTGYSIKCLQIDAAINFGNSGGPLLNSLGQVVGINSSKIAAEGYEGIGFSIPITEAKIIIDDLIKYGYVKNRVMLGITGVDITQPGYEGFQIQSINENSCLVGTSARVGDIITSIQGVKVTEYTTLRTELSKYKVGDKIKLDLIRVDVRTGTKSNLTVTCTLKEYQG